MIYTLVYTKKAIKDIKKLRAAKLAGKAQEICILVSTNAMTSYSKPLYGDLKGKRSIRINLQHRMVYEIFEEEKIIKVISMWSHYE